MVKKIGFVVEKFPMGGVEHILIDLGNYLVRNGVDVYIICCRNFQEAYPQGKSQLFSIIELGVDYQGHTKELADALIPVAKELSLEVLSCHYSTPYISYIKRNTGCKFIFTQHGMPFWEVKEKLQRESLKKSVFAKVKCRTWIKIANTSWYSQYRNRVKKKYMKVYEDADSYMCLCNAYKRELERYLGIDPSSSKIWVAYNPQCVPMEMPIYQRDKIILFAGRLTFEDKRADRLIRIWNKIYKELPDWKLVICGDGPERRNLENMVSPELSESVVFEGWKSDLGEYFKTASILCLTSTHESWGMVLTESQAHGLPAMAFSCSEGVKEILSPSGVNGILVKPYDEKKYANELLNLALDKEKRDEIARSAFESVKKYTVESCGKAWLNTLSKLI